MTEPRRERRKFTKEFKAETVRLVREEQRTVGQVCRDLDLTRSAVSNWLAQARVDEEATGKGELTSAEREELRQLRKENRVLRMEREILKRAATFFAKESA